MGFCSFCGSELNESDDGPEFLHSLGGKRPFAGAAERLSNWPKAAFNILSNTFTLIDPERPFRPD
jgi:hypothetical protein